MFYPPNILSIAGSDSGGGAGIQADLKTIMANGGYGLTVVTALTAQNGIGVYGIEAPTADFVALQLKVVLEGFRIAAAKTGMLYSASIIKKIAPLLENRDFPLVVDPVSVSQSGHKLLEDDAIQALIDYMLPNCSLLTPNGPETEMLTGISVKNTDDAIRAGEKLLSMGPKAVLVKGGHMAGPVMVNDCLLIKGQEPKVMPQARVETENNHGTGCTLSAAIACGMGKGFPVEISVAQAQKYINLALRKSYAPGKGRGPVNHAGNLTII